MPKPTLLKREAVEMRRYEVAVQRLLPAMLLDGWKCRLHRDPLPGDLVMLQSAPMSVWHLSFYREKLDGYYHLLESLKTGELCRWGNVGFHVIDEDTVGLGSTVRWSDAQFGFADKFTKACKRADFYINLPFIDKFEDDLVHIGFRTRYSLDKIITAVAPIRWSKITLSALVAELRAGEAAHDAARGAEGVS